MDKSKADWLREFADAMEADPEGWFKRYEYMVGPQWLGVWSERKLTDRLLGGHPIRRRPRTVTRYDRNGERVELPEPMREEPVFDQEYWYLNINLRGVRCQNFDWKCDREDRLLLGLGNCFATQADAQAWATYFKSQLEANDHD